MGKKETFLSGLTALSLMGTVAVRSANAQAIEQLTQEPVSLADTLVAGNYTGGQSSPQDVCDPEVVAMNIAALNALHIVTATGLQTVVPASSPYCYNLPCPAQVQEAKVENCNRAKKLAELLELAEKL